VNQNTHLLKLANMVWHMIGHLQSIKHTAPQSFEIILQLTPSGWLED
jgi:uncharacterized pyridoxal phosphate-containing UPF0001 family protein